MDSLLFGFLYELLSVDRVVCLCQVKGDKCRAFAYVGLIVDVSPGCVEAVDCRLHQPDHVVGRAVACFKAELLRGDAFLAYLFIEPTVYEAFEQFARAGG